MSLKLHPACLSGTLAAPASKSEAHRRMICAGLSQGETVLDGFMESDDMAATRRCLKSLGAEFSLNDDTLTIRGACRKTFGSPMMDCGESGATLRFFVPIAMAQANGGVFRMHGSLSKRPMDVYRDLFVPQGTNWRMGVGTDRSAELHVLGRLANGHYELPGNVSSQFVSGLLFALPLLSGESTLTVLPPVESEGYIRMTLEALRLSGIVYEETAPFTWRIPGRQQYQPVSGRLTGDYTQAAMFLCAAALGHKVTVTGLNPVTTQGDRAILSYLEAMGAVITENENGIAVEGRHLHGAEFDMHSCPDLAPILALTCQLAEGESRLRRCGRLRLKESDRLTGTVDILNAMGGNARIEGDDIVVTGVRQLRGGATLKTNNDHRMVMLAAMAALHADSPVTVEDETAVSKSWPDFFNVYASLGGQME